MSINISVAELKELKPRILVVGVGGAGGNAINGMIETGMKGVEFAAINTDAQDLKENKAEIKIQLGSNLTKGLGAGARTDIGQASADESLNEIINFLQGSNMIFITAGMGGGTGTGASHVIARAAKELNILTVGVVTLPFLYEGPSRMRRAMQGLEELKKHVDTNIVIPNQNLFRVANEKTTFEESFELSNRVLKHGVQSVTDLMVRPGLINLDFADIETVMSGMGKAMMGTGEAEGDKRASEAADTALKNPLIDEYSLKGAKGLLINITGGKDLTLFEVDEAVNRVRAEVDPEAELIIGAITDSEMQGKMRVSIVATALDNQGPQVRPVVSMVHRIQSRNSGKPTNEINTNTNSYSINNETFNATEGATALDMNIATESYELAQEKENKVSDLPLTENISIENATYLQNLENSNQEEKLAEDKKENPNFEVESIELMTPQLFSDDNQDHLINEEKETNQDPLVMNETLEKTQDFSQEKDQEMFEKLDTEEEFEIPAFLRKQKN